MDYNVAENTSDPFLLELEDMNLQIMEMIRNLTQKIANNVYSQDTISLARNILFDIIDVTTDSYDADDDDVVDVVDEISSSASKHIVDSVECLPSLDDIPSSKDFSASQGECCREDVPVNLNLGDRDDSDELYRDLEDADTDEWIQYAFIGWFLMKNIVAVDGLGPGSGTE